MEVLYKRTKTGAIQEWKIEVFDEDTPRILVTQGQFDGKKQEYPEFINEGKQKRNALEQAKFQATSQWTSKLDNGYKAPSEFGWVYDAGLSREDLLRFLTAKLPLDNTDANGNKKPQLASKDPKKAIYDAYLQPKLNGVRSFFFAKLEPVDLYTEGLFGTDPAQEGQTLALAVHAVSREGKSYDFATKKIRQALIPFFELNPDVILDGELYIHGDALQDISGMVRKEEYVPERHDRLQFHIYDVGIDMIQEHRYNFIQTEVAPHVGELIHLVDFHIVTCEEEVIALHKQFTEQGYEGAILRNYKGAYQYGKRNNDLIKIKEFQDAEYKIIGFNFGKRGIQDLKFVLEVEPGKEFEAVPIGTVAQKSVYAEQLESGELIGKMATIKFFEFTKEGKPHHANLMAIRDYE